MNGSSGKTVHVESGHASVRILDGDLRPDDRQVHGLRAVVGHGVHAFRILNVLRVLDVRIRTPDRTREINILSVQSELIEIIRQLNGLCRVHLVDRTIPVDRCGALKGAVSEYPPLGTKIRALSGKEEVIFTYGTF